MGLHAPPASTGDRRCLMDDVRVTEVEAGPVTRYEAESAQVTLGVKHATWAGGLDQAGSRVEFGVTASAAGTYTARINYANAGEFATLGLRVNDTLLGQVGFPRTGASGAFSANRIEVPVVLGAGSNRIRLDRSSLAVELDWLEIDGAPHAITVTAAPKARGPRRRTAAAPGGAAYRFDGRRAAAGSRSPVTIHPGNTGRR